MKLTLMVCLISIFISSMSLHALGIDQAYITNNGKTWGQIFTEKHKNSSFRKSKSYALVIGVSNFDYYKNLPTLNDAPSVKTYLYNVAKFDHVHLLTEDKVTVSRVKALMDQFISHIGKRDRFFFYWSGHGETVTHKGRNLGYLPVKSSKKPGEMVSMEFIKRWDSKLKAKQALFVLDSCFSGLAGFVSKSKQKVLTLQQLTQPSHQLLTAGTHQEKTIADRNGSVFTNALLEGLSGHADTRSSAFLSDGIISTTELKLFVQQRVAHLKDEKGWKKTITPQIRDLRANEGEFFFDYNFSEGRDDLDGNIPETVIILPKSGGSSVDIVNGLAWRTNVEPLQVNLKQAYQKIVRLNQQTGKKWRLPTFVELGLAAESGLLGKFSNLEVWAKKVNNRVASYNVNFRDPYSNVDANKSRHLLLVRNLK